MDRPAPPSTRWTRQKPGTRRRGVPARNGSGDQLRAHTCGTCRRTHSTTPAHGRAIRQGTPFVDFTRQYEFRANSSLFARQDFDARGNIEATKGSGGGTTLSNQGVMAVRQGFEFLNNRFCKPLTARDFWHKSSFDGGLPKLGDST